MPTRDIVPTTEPAMNTWLTVLTLKVPLHAVTLGILPAEVATFQADVAMLAWVLNAAPLARAWHEQLTSFKSELLSTKTGAAPLAAPLAAAFPVAPAAVAAGALHRVREFVQRVKTSATYTVTIGHDLGIIAPPVLVEATPKPAIREKTLPASVVHILWVKGPHEGVDIQCKRVGDADFVTLGRVNHSPYIDTRPPLTAGMSEVRQYRARYVDKDVEVGVWSDALSVVTTP